MSRGSRSCSRASHGAALAALLGLAACRADVYLGQLEADAGSGDGGGGGGGGLDAGLPAEIAPGEYDLSYLEQIAVVCDTGLASAQAGLVDLSPATVSLASGTVELATPSGLIVIGGDPIAKAFGVESLVLAQGAPDLPADLYAAELRVDGPGPSPMVRHTALLAIDPALATARDLGGRAAVMIGMPAQAAECTLTYRVRLCRDPAHNPCTHEIDFGIRSPGRGH